MMRPRKSDKHLPPCVYQRHGAYYLVKRNKWTRLGADLHEALIAYAGTVTVAGSGGMVKLIDKVYTAHSPKLSANTRKVYKQCAGRLKRNFQEFDPHQVKPKHVAELKMAMADKPIMANQVLGFLRICFAYALEWQLVDSNPTIGIKPYPTKKRTRYLTDSEFSAIREKANPVLQIVMDLCYLTGQRVGDVLAIQRKDLRDDGIYFKAEKTGSQVVVAWSPSLKEVVARAKKLNPGVIHLNLLVGIQKQPLSYHTVLTYWWDACEKAGGEDARIHDMRAKSATDARDQGFDAQSLMGHGSASMTERYIRNRKIPVVTGPVMKGGKK